ncbi:MAG: biotin--[acetyl-CoA-carboxylase] ligase [Elusimicrobia bacterium]|nr:biotin--[acetyl-CoA-carboxylase] ligase [Elusimicrobiota bacterium]
MIKKAALNNYEKDLINSKSLKEIIPYFAGKKIHYFLRTNSTQDTAKGLADTGEKEGTVVLAERQSYGRGRFSRNWFSPRGGLWFSIILYPKISPEKNLQFSLITAISLCETLGKMFNIKPLIKWPNDIIYNEKKLGGILVESALISNRVKWTIIGAGLNVNNVLSAGIRKKAVSLKSILRYRINRTKLLAEILKNYYFNYKIFKIKGFKYFRTKFQRYSFLNNKNIKVEEGGRIYSGVVKEIDENGFLWIRLKNKIIRKILAGTILKYE